MLTHQRQYKVDRQAKDSIENTIVVNRAMSTGKPTHRSIFSLKISKIFAAYAA